MKQMKPMNLGGLALRVMLPVAALLVLAAYVSCPAAFLDEMNKFSSQSLKPTVVPADGTMVTAHESLVFTFPQAMTPSSVTVSGTIGTGTATWSTVSKTNDTLTLNNANAVVWTAGTGLTLILTIASGGTVEYAFTFEVFRGTCVSTSGADGNPGTQRSPKRNIKAGIDTAQSLYTTNCQVRVAGAEGGSGGNYTTNWSTSLNRINIVEGISLLGGYRSNWQERSWTLYETTIQDLSPDGYLGARTYSIYCGPGITNATIIEGLKIIGGQGLESAALGCSGASPTIQNNIIIAGSNETSTATAIRNGIYLELNGTMASNPLIYKNRINGILEGGGANIRTSYGIRLNSQSSPIIRENEIYGGITYLSLNNQSTSYCIFSTNSSSVPLIERNLLRGGIGYSCFCLYLQGASSSIRIENNLIIAGQANNSGGSDYSIYIRNTSPIIRNNTIGCGNTAGDALYTYGVYIYDASSAPTIDNNLFYYYFGVRGNTTYGICEAALATTPASIKNNSFFSWENISGRFDFFDNNTSGYSAPLIPIANNAANNIDQDPGAGFIGYSSFYPTDATVRSWGIDGSGVVPAWTFSNDKNNNSRTGNGSTGWSIGCYEVD